MDAHVIIATKGRPKDVGVLLERLAAQSKLPSSVCIVGTQPDDLEGLPEASHAFTLHRLISQRAGLCIQRNLGLRQLANTGGLAGPAFVVFFDDDFRPASDWLARCADTFASDPSIVGVTGHVLADGAHNVRLTEHDAQDFLSSRRAPLKHWASGSMRRPSVMYGCNMAFRESVARRCTFDENLPLYGWQEDRDFTAQALKLGRAVYEPSCRGVHLGQKSGKTSGLKLGYSQVANIVYLMGKQAIAPRMALKFIAKNILSNAARTAARTQLSTTDYAGRLRGNVTALSDLARGRCHPLRILELH